MSDKLDKMEKRFEQVTFIGEDPSLIKALRILIDEGRCETKGVTFQIKEEDKISYARWLEDLEKDLRYQMRVFGKEVYDSHKELLEGWERHLKDIGAFIE